MLHRCAEILTDKLFQVNNIENSKRPVFIYGFELALSTAASILSILIISAGLSLVASAAIFLPSFCSLRMVCGGFHAKTYGRCFLFTNSIYLATIFSTFLIETNSPSAIPLIGGLFLFFSTIIILTLAPVKNSRHPLSQDRYLRNRKMAHVFSLILLSIAIVAFKFKREHTFLLISFTITAVAVMMIVPKLKERRT